MITCGDVTNYVTANATSACASVTENANATIEVICYPNLSIEKFTNDVHPLYGEETEFIIRVTNNGPGTAENVTIRDILPGEITATSPTEFFISQLLPNETIIKHIRGIVNTTEKVCVNNTAVLNATDKWKNIYYLNDIIIIYPNQNCRENITINGTVFNDTNENGIIDENENGIPNNKVYLSDGSFAITDANGYYEFNLKSENSNTYIFAEKISGTHNTTPAIVEISLNDNQEINFGVNDTKEGAPQLKIEKSTNKNNVVPGGNIYYSLNISNPGDEIVYNLSVSDKLPYGWRPRGQEFLAIKCSDNKKYDVSSNITSNNSRTTMGFNKPSLSPGEYCTITYRIHIPKNNTKGIYTNFAAVSGKDENGNNILPDWDTESVFSGGETAKPSVYVSKRANVTIVNINDTVRFEISLKNTGDLPLSLNVTDYLPYKFEAIGNTSFNVELNIGEEKDISVFAYVTERVKNKLNINRVVVDGIAENGKEIEETAIDYVYLNQTPECDENYSDVECSVGMFVKGYVYDDENRNGIKEENETGIENIMVYLNDRNGIRQTITDSNGKYKFMMDAACDPENLSEFNVYADEIYGMQNTTLMTVEGQISSLNDENANFGFVKILTEGKIHGHVFEDTNGDGSYNAQEQGLAHVKIYLMNNMGETLAETTTNENGSYEFSTGVPYDEAELYVAADNIYGMHNTSPQNIQVMLNWSNLDQNVDFGFDKDDIAVKFTKFTNTTSPRYNDTVEFAVYIENIGKKSIYNISVSDTLPDEFENLSSTTFTIPEISPGEYKVVYINALVNASESKEVKNFVLLEFKNNTGNNYSSSAQIYLCINYEYLCKSCEAKITGKVFNDTNGDGNYDASENEIGNANIYLSNGLWTQSDSNGDYELKFEISCNETTNVSVMIDNIAEMSNTTPAIVDVSLNSTQNIAVVNFGFNQTKEGMGKLRVDKQPGMLVTPQVPEIYHTLIISNTGNESMYNISAIDSLPTRWKFGGVISVNCSGGGNLNVTNKTRMFFGNPVVKVYVNITLLHPGETCDMAYSVIVPENVKEGQYVNKVVISGKDENGNDLEKDSASAKVVIMNRQNPSLSISKTTITTDVNITDIAYFYVNVTNDGDVPLNLTVYDRLPPGFEPIGNMSFVDHLKVNESRTYNISALVMNSAISGLNVNIVEVNTTTDYGQKIYEMAYSFVYVHGECLCVRNTNISGNVFIDSNANGIMDENETGIENVKVYLNNGRVAITDEKGYYLFNVTVMCNHSKTFNVSVDQIRGRYNTTPIIVTVTVNETQNATVNFGFVNMGIKINKTANETKICAGQNVTYYYNVTNNGNVSLAKINVSDDKCTNVVCPGTTLAANESMICNCTTALTQAGNITNIATVNATVSQGTLQGINISDEDDATVEVESCGASIIINKTANETKTSVGQNVTYYYNVTNNGNVSLTNISVSDDKCEVVNCQKDNLNVNESMTCNCSTTLTQCGNVTNTADVTAIDGQGNTVTAYNSATVEVICNASINLNKTANSSQINTGENVTYYYNVTNNGNVNLTNINVSDDKCSNVVCPKDNLAVNESMTCNCSTTLTQCGNVTNTADVTAIDGQGNTVQHMILQQLKSSVMQA